MRQSQHPSRIIAEAAVALRDPVLIPGALLAAGMFMAAGLVPYFGLFMGLFSPVPLLYFYYRRGRSFGLTMSVVAFVAVGLLYILLGRPLGGLVFAEYCVMAVLLGEGLHRRFPPGFLVGTASVGIMALAMGVLILAGIGSGQSPLTLGRNMVDHQIRTSLVMYEQLFQMPSGTPGETEETVSDLPVYESEPYGNGIQTDYVPPALTPQGEMLARAMMAVFPGLMIMGTMLVAWANLMMGRFFLARSMSLPPPLDNFKGWRAPERMVFALILSGFVSFVFQGGLQVVAINILMVVCLIYFFQGLSIVAFWFDKKHVPLAMRIVVYTLMGLQQYLVIVVAAVGLFDLWFDYRKLKGAQQENG